MRAVKKEVLLPLPRLLANCQTKTREKAARVSLQSVVMLHRALFVAVSVFASGFAYAQDLTKPVTYTTKSVTFSQAFSDLSKQAGVGLFPEGDMADEIIVLRLNNVLLKDAMQKIADTVGAEWVKKPDGFELDRSPDQVDKFQQDIINRRVQILTTCLTKAIKKAKADQPYTQDRINQLVAAATTTPSQSADGQGTDFRAMSQLRDSAPDSVAALQLLSKIDIRQLAALNDSSRLAFSNKPTKMELLIPGDLSQFAEDFMTAHNAFYDAYSKAKKPDTPNPYFSIPESAITSAPDRFVLDVSSQMLNDDISARMIAYDAQDHPIAGSSISLSFDDEMNDMMSQRARIARETANEKEIPVSPATKQMLEFIRNSTSGSGPDNQRLNAISGELRQALLHPEENDPLSYALSEAFLGIADQRNENLVVYPDDSMFLVAMFAGMEGSFKPSLVLQGVSGLGQVLPTTVTEQDGWLCLSPVDRLGAMSKRMNRAALGTYLRDDDANDYVSIDSTAKLAASIQGYDLPLLCIFIPLMLTPDQMFGLDNDMAMMKLYASLNDSQLTRLQNNAPIPIGEFNNDQLAIINHFVFQADHQDDPVPVKQGETLAEQLASQETPDTFPDGIPADATLTMSTDTTPTYFCTLRQDNNTFTSPTDINTIAYYIYHKDHPDKVDPNPTPEIVSIQAGEERQLTFNVNLSPDCTLTSFAKEDRKTPGKVWTVANLPDDIKAQIAKAEQSFQNVPVQSDGAPPEAPPPTVAPPAKRR